jgi:uncharacterized DUF497 family protein
MDDDLFSSCEGFDWDDGNVDKNWQEHGVAFWECEEVFFNEPLVVQADRSHPAQEERYYALGQTNSGRKLFVVFTIRNNLIRVISAREMTRKEKKIYDQLEKKDSNT